MTNEKTLEVLVVEDQINIVEDKRNTKEDFKNYLEKELVAKGYNTNITVATNYNEYLSLKDKPYDVVVTDIMIPGNAVKIGDLVRNEIKNNKEQIEQILERIDKYINYALPDFYKKDLKEEIKNFLINPDTEVIPNFYGHKEDTYAAGILIAKDFKDKGKKFTVYTTMAGEMYSHAIRGIVLNGILGVIPIEDWNSVTRHELEVIRKRDENEQEEMIKKNLKPSTPESGKITFISSAGEKSRLYPEAVRLAIEYQTKQIK